MFFINFFLLNHFKTSSLHMLATYFIFSLNLLCKWKHLVTELMLNRIKNGRLYRQELG